jgi:hypothetical protein
MKRIVLTGFSAMVLLLTGSGHSQGQSRSPSFQYVATAGGELRGLSTPYTANPGSRQFVYFSNDKLTIAATIEVEDIRGGVALVRVRTKSYPGTVDRETSEKELKSALAREYTYVPMEKLSLAVDGGGVLSLEGAIADESGNLSKPIAPLPVGPEAGQIMLMSPALLRGDRVMANLKVGAGTGPGVRGNPAIALYAPPEDLFIFALQPFEGATACEVTLGRAMFRLEGNDYTLFSERPIIAGNQESRIWVLHVAKYIPSRVAHMEPSPSPQLTPGELHELLARLGVEGSTSRH